MSKTRNPLDTRRTFDLGNGRQGYFYSLPALEEAGWGQVSRLPVSLRLVLEAVLRNCDGQRVSEAAVRALANWQPNAPRTEEIPFVVARIVLQDFTGVPLLVDLAAMRSAVARLGKNPKLIEPLVPVDLVVDHSVQVDFAGSPQAWERNLDFEFARNRERYQFLKWGMQAFDTFKVVPPGIGIVHQVNLEYLAQGVLALPGRGCGRPANLLSGYAGRHGFPHHDDQRLGHCGLGRGRHRGGSGHVGATGLFPHAGRGGGASDRGFAGRRDGHRLGVDAHAAAASGQGGGQVCRVLRPGRGRPAGGGPRHHRQHGARIRGHDGFFPIDAECVNYLRATGRTDAHCRIYENYYRAQGLWACRSTAD